MSRFPRPTSAITCTTLWWGRFRRRPGTKYTLRWFTWIPTPESCASPTSSYRPRPIRASRVRGPRVAPRSEASRSLPMLVPSRRPGQPAGRRPGRPRPQHSAGVAPLAIITLSPKPPSRRSPDATAIAVSSRQPQRKVRDEPPHRARRASSTSASPIRTAPERDQPLPAEVGEQLYTAAIRPRMRSAEGRPARCCAPPPGRTARIRSQHDRESGGPQRDGGDPQPLLQVDVRPGRQPHPGPEEERAEPSEPDQVVPARNDRGPGHEIMSARAR